MNVVAACVFGVLLVLSCASAQPALTPQKEVGVVGSDALLEHSVLYQKKGTRSESRSGYLRAGGIRVPDCFEIVSDGVVTYRFYSRKTPWGNDGYFPDKSAARPARGDFRVGDAMLKRGWTDDERFAEDIPAGWLLVRSGAVTGWVNLSKLEGFIAAKGLKQMSRMEMFRTTK